MPDLVSLKYLFLLTVLPHMVTPLAAFLVGLPIKIAMRGGRQRADALRYGLKPQGAKGSSRADVRRAAAEISGGERVAGVTPIRLPSLPRRARGGRFAAIAVPKNPRALFRRFSRLQKQGTYITIKARTASRRRAVPKPYQPGFA